MFVPVFRSPVTRRSGTGTVGIGPAELFIFGDSTPLPGHHYIEPSIHCPSLINKQVDRSIQSGYSRTAHWSRRRQRYAPVQLKRPRQHPPKAGPPSRRRHGFAAGLAGSTSVEPHCLPRTPASVAPPACQLRVPDGHRVSIAINARSVPSSVGSFQCNDFTTFQRDPGRLHQVVRDSCRSLILPHC